MGIGLRDRKLLWVRSGNRCAFPQCERKLVLEAQDEVVQDTIVSQEAHIVARATEGPRGDSILTPQERDLYDNLILLCLEHHKVVDDDPETWTVQRLHHMKHEHEAAVEAAMSPKDELSAKQELLYATLVSGWLQRAKVDDWQIWTSWPLAVRPHGPKGLLEDLDATGNWIFTRPWPGLYPLVDQAFENYRRVNADLAMVLHYSADPDYKEGYEIDTFYKKEWVEQEQYDKMANEFDWIVDLIHDLVFELTRAAEHVIDQVRLFMDPLFRTEEGRLVVERQGAGFYFTQWRPHYSHDEASEQQPYPGIRNFLTKRETRDVRFGDGVNEGAYRRITPITIGDEGRETWT